MAVGVLKAIWGKREGYVFVPRRKVLAGGKSKWDEGKAYRYPDEWEAIKARITESASDGWDTYWCPLVFDKPVRQKDAVLPKQNLLWADLDYVNPVELGLKPSVAWKSSDERYQALWLLDDMHDISIVEKVNRDLTYKIGADKGGWDVGQVLRVPATPNYKYTPPQKGELLWAETRRFDLDKIAEVVSVAETMKPEKAIDSLEKLLEPWSIPDRVRDLLTVDPLEVEVGDRSDRLWEIETSLLESGVPILDVVDIIAICPWNKFKGRKGEREQIYNEVLKADKHVKIKLAEKSKEIEILDEELYRRSDEWALPFQKFAVLDIEKPQWLVDGIWQRGTYGMIAGEPKTYKSVQATDLALSVASGKPFLGHFDIPNPGTVLYIQEENNVQTVQDRVFKIASQKGLLTSTSKGLALPNDLPIYFSNNFGINLTDKGSRALLEDTIKCINPVLIILDPLYMMMGGVDENSATEVGDLLKWLTHLRNVYSVSILLCHHYNKGNGNTRGGQRVRGSSAFHAWVESAIYVKTTTELYTVKIEREFRAFPTMPELTFKLELGAPGELYYNPQLLGVAEVDGLPTSELKLEEICTIISTAPHTIDEIASKSKLTKREAERAIELLSEAGRVEKAVGGGKGVKSTYILK